MTLLSDLRNLITRKKSPLGRENAEPSADVDVEEVIVAETVGEVEEVEVVGRVAFADDPAPLARAEIADKASGVDAAEVIESIGSRLDTQGERLDEQAREMRQLIQHLEQVSLVLKETAEIKGQCAQVIDLVNGQASESRSRTEAVADAVAETRRQEDAVLKAISAVKGREDAVLEAINAVKEREEQVLEAVKAAKGRGDAVFEAVNAARGREDAVMQAVNEAVDNAVAAGIKRLGDASSRDGETLKHIQQQVESNAEALRATGKAGEGVAQHLEEIKDFSGRTHRVIADLDKAHKTREAEVAAHFAASKKTMMTLAFACTLASLLALVVAVIALLT